MREVVLIFGGTTDNKVVYHTREYAERFTLYIPKWRVPLPWPEKIRFGLDDDPTATAPKPQGPPSAPYRNLEEPLIAGLKKRENKTKTVRYCPIGAQNDWEVGEPYIPLVWLDTPPQNLLRIEVHWDRTAGN